MSVRLRTQRAGDRRCQAGAARWIVFDQGPAHRRRQTRCRAAIAVAFITSRGAAGVFFGLTSGRMPCRRIGGSQGERRGRRRNHQMPFSPSQQDSAMTTENAVPSPPSPAVPRASGFPVVGIGASAGGLAAFEAFFSGMPAGADTGMAFVLVQHLAPDHKSMLTELVRRYTRMQTFEVVDGMAVQPDCVYIIPPNHNMALLGGTLQLLDATEPRALRLPIDFFFRSLAADQHERAVGIVLSGTGSDGTAGLRAIKHAGGLALVQTPASTEFDGMPRSALATGLVDFELAPALMPAQLIACCGQAMAAGGAPATLATAAPAEALLPDNDLNKVFVLLRAQIGHDFSQYKPSTILRRIDRRMAVHRIDTLAGYIRYLQRSPAEVEALFFDLLIGVTAFFRDPAAFSALEQQVIARLVEGKPAGAAIRVWVPACSSGEEAYSIAILLAERAEALKVGCTLQVFATDIDPRAIATARAGQYPAAIAADVSPERLARYFTAQPDGGGYRVQKSIRDLMVFSEQDLIKDPPFSRLDLISCRNLLIYLGAELQQKLVPLFHYALNPGGWLFLGTSEGVGDVDSLFSVADRAAKIYLRRDDVPRPQLGRIGRIGRSLPPSWPLDTLLEAGPPRTLGSAAARPAMPARLPLRELTEQALLQLVVPTGALVNRNGDVLYLHGRTGLFLEPAPGEAGGAEPVQVAGLRVRTNGHHTLVNLTVRPMLANPAAPLAAPLYLVILEQAAPGSAPGSASGLASDSAPPALAGKPDRADPAAPAPVALTLAEAEARIAALTDDLRVRDEHLRSSLEELAQSNQELKAFNEEMQSVNEELQSTNEELETSKEELQSTNEELDTVNAELQGKVADLAHSNNDMNNLLAGTGIGTVFVDQRLRVLGFTPAAAQIINLIPSDVGRPLPHFHANLVGYDRLGADLREVLDTLVHKSIEVRTPEGQHYTMRLQPYRTLDNVVEGAVITFVDITDIRRSEADLLRANTELLRLAVVVRDASDAIIVHDLAGRTLAWNPAAERLYGWSEAEALQLNRSERTPPALRDASLARLARLTQAEVLQPFRTRRLDKAGGEVEVDVVSSALVDDQGRIYAVASTERAAREGTA
jgi:two-component system CheB/CheR fusion protein